MFKKTLQNYNIFSKNASILLQIKLLHLKTQLFNGR